MFYNRIFERSLCVSVFFHICLAIIFFFVTFPQHLSLLKTIEISMIELPGSEQPVLKHKPIESRRIGAIKRKPELKLKRTPESIKKPIVPYKPMVVKEVKQIITPIPLPPAPVGIEKNEFHGEIPVPKGVTNTEVHHVEEGKTSQGSSIPPPNAGAKYGNDKETTGPNIYISGPASARKALYQPKFSIPSWLEKRGQSLQGKLKIWVLPDGSVDRVEIEESFGYAEIDRLAQSSVYKWRFYKLPPHEERIDWGSISIAINLEK
ncbi:MAG: TonB family protein [bacterium]|nr:TonB family protein [bacterium]